MFCNNPVTFVSEGLNYEKHVFEVFGELNFCSFDEFLFSPITWIWVLVRHQ